MRRIYIWTALVVVVSLCPAMSQAPVLKDPDHFSWSLPDPFPTRQQWEQRAQQLRQKLLLSAGLWPERERAPLNPRIFDIREGKGFRVAKVYFESFPGFLATGNIYYPTVGKPPYPAVLTPHGHWEYGRLQNTEGGSIPGRCIDFARQGYVVFSIDMVGYNDSFQLPHDGGKSRAQLAADVPLPYESRLFRADWIFPEAELYGFNLGGMQLWNSIRALDFLISLPEVDPARIGVTGASGGATQTILVMAADERVKVAAPVNIIGAAKHPGCGCENIPGLWVDTSTIELSATFAPRPLLLVSATEDPWTPMTPTRELPWLKRYYDLFGAGDSIANAHISAGHNYNAQSRAAVYAFFRKHLNPPGPAIDSPDPVAAEMKSLGDLRVFPDTRLPDAAKAGRTIAADWQKTSAAALDKLFPSDAGGLAAFRSSFGEALALVLDVEKVAPGKLTRQSIGGKRIARGPRGDALELESYRGKGKPTGAVLLAMPESFGRLGTRGGGALPWVESLVQKGNVIYRVSGYASGAQRIPERTWNSAAWASSYNRSNQILGIQEIMTAMAAIREDLPNVPLTVVGLERTGLLAAFAAAVQGGASRVVVDLNGEDPGDDASLVRLLHVGAIRRVGDLRTAVLAIDGQVQLINPGPTFDGAWYREQARGTGAKIVVGGATPFAAAGFLSLLE